jgi:uncharacterized tellurite resistance protein B-like protein
VTTLVPDKQHPALDVAEPERVDYLTVVASMAYADHHADDSELARVTEMCEHLEISAEGIEKVLAAARDPDRIALDGIIDRLKTSALRFALLVDAIDVAYADEKIDPQETAEIESLADRLGVNHAQVAMIHRYVSTRRGLSSDDEVSKDIVTGLVAAGIPLATLAMATIAGVPAVGVGIGAALGVGSYFSVRWLAKRLRRNQPSEDAASEENASES